MADRSDINRGAPVLIAPRPRTKSPDPKLTRKGGAAHRGGIFVSVAALVFFAYVFDLGGLQSGLNSYFVNLDRTARSHNGDVAAMVRVVLPYVAIGVGSIACLFMLNLLLQLFFAGSKKKPKAKARKATVAPAAVPGDAASKKEKPASEPAVLVRPYRPPMPGAKTKGDGGGPKRVKTVPKSAS